MNSSVPSNQSSNDGDWLWAQFMDWCRKHRLPPAMHDDLFKIVGRLRERQMDQQFGQHPYETPPDETAVLYTQADAEALCAIAAAGAQHVTALDAARYRWLKAHWYDTPLIGHTDAADLDAIIDSQFADEATDAEQPPTTGENNAQG